MSERRAYLDRGSGETRAVVTLDGKPERLLIFRDGDRAVQSLGARLVARVRAVRQAQALAFLDLGDGPDGVLNISPQIGRLVEGAAVEVQIRSEARSGKGATVRYIGAADGPPRLLEAAPNLEDQLTAFVDSASVLGGAIARSMADNAQEEALQTLFSLPAGGALTIERTRALVAVDVDLGAGAGSESKRAARAANLAALGVAARLLRLKGIGGLVVIDLVGRGHDGPALLAAARACFSPDNPGVALGPISRFGTLELTVPRRARGALDILADATGSLSPLSLALALARALEREAVADRGGRFIGLAAPTVAELAVAPVDELITRLGARLTLRAETGREPGAFEVARA